MCEKEKYGSIIPKEPSEPLGAPLSEREREAFMDEEEENNYYSLGGDNDLTEPEDEDE
jgi:hypothetical protein